MSMATTSVIRSVSATTIQSCSSSQVGSCSTTRGSSPALHSSASKSSRLGNQRDKGLLVQIRARNVPPKQGRGSNAKKAAAQGVQRRMRGQDSDLDAGWTQVVSSDELTPGKNKAIIHNNAGYILVRRDETIFSIEANCTVCKFPVIEGKISEEEEGNLSIRCPLCHSKFSLKDGAVMEYCPKDGPLSWIVGTLKDKTSPATAKVYPARISKSGRVYVRFIGGF
ncbi:unnamed protein product [Sphagnum troendelagicum]|uniref:Rieske-like [2Fe-2S] domain-containing protein n=1 Tax=Sphagnum troendelagicum TaxID=128251 RepID=A0ABP0TKI0_9BRYO